MAGSSGSPKSHCATMSIFGSALARSTTVFPMRPAAPTSNTRTGDDFMLPQPSPYPLPSKGRGDSSLTRCDVLFASPLAEGERIEVRGSRSEIIFFSLEFFQRFAQAVLVCFAHFAQWQANFARHRATPA